MKSTTTPSSHMLDNVPYSYLFKILREPLKAQPMSESFKQFAMEYIRLCEQGSLRPAFEDFERQVQAEVKRIAEDEKAGRYIFRHSFVEYVIEEVQMANCYLNIPKRHRRKRLQYKLWIQRGRVHTCQLWGTTPALHAHIYREVINNALIEHGIAESLTSYWDWYS